MGNGDGECENGREGRIGIEEGREWRDRSSLGVEVRKGVGWDWERGEMELFSTNEHTVYTYSYASGKNSI